MTTGIMRTALLNLIFVGVGGFFGSIGRYLLAGFVYQLFPNLVFPTGTAVVNILGCFLIGFIAGLAELLFGSRLVGLGVLTSV